MQIVPVIDVKDGVAVHAVGGLREFYRPVQSALTDSSDPVRILNVLKRRFSIERCYVADIDALEQRSANRCLLAEMNRVGIPMMLDAGVRSIQDVADLLELDCDRIILGSETVPDVELLREIVQTYSAERIVFSIDLKGGHLMTGNPLWKDLAPTELALLIAETGIQQFVLLDLSAVGTGRGLSTLESCRELRRQLPQAHITAGGGIRNTTHLSQLQDAGASSALVATALHSGCMTAHDVRRFQDTSAVSRTAS